MKASAIIKSFGFQIEEEPISIYPFSPVYRIKGAENDWIIKKTQHPYQKAQRFVAYTKNLEQQGIDVVVPVEMSAPNPATIGEATYVVYPFIEGHPYSGKDAEIVEAGRLLGKIHSFSPVENEFGLDPYDVFDFNEEEVTQSVNRIAVHASTHEVELPIELEKRLFQAVAQQDELKGAGLVHVATPHDFKANNLVYTPRPHLIDPDNAGWVPRIFDLALVLLLFHNELPSAPDKPFTESQWKLFLTGYNEFITLTAEEKLLWPKALEHVFLDEVMWLMADVEEDWHNPAQRHLFQQLAALLVDTKAYALT
ncbi:phosphotransferase [Planococcus dechangensis]|uniref:Phosphotransferase n=1 Tax=Planococcus dechangensis TaxID=1176255 RepID=A0ABV9MFC3_9BACL